MMYDDDSVTQEDLDNLTTESEILGEDEITMAERLLRENLPMAVIGVIKLARNGTSDRIRYEASKYIIERNMGRLQDIQILANDPLKDFADMMSDVDATD